MAEKHKIKNWFKAFIPSKISNRAVLGFFEFLRKLQNIFRRDYSGAVRANREAMDRHLDTLVKNKGFVEDQNNYGNMTFGRATMKFSGCEIFAAYNALNALKDERGIKLPDLINAFERDGIVMNGKFGTSPKAVRDYMRGLGYRTEISHRVSEFERISKENDTLILTMYNDGSDIMKEIHTVNISKDDNGFTAHNVTGNGRALGPCSNITELMGRMNGGRAKGISLIGIKK